MKKLLTIEYLYVVSIPCRGNESFELKLQLPRIGYQFLIEVMKEYSHQGQHAEWLVSIPYRGNERTTFYILLVL